VRAVALSIGSELVTGLVLDTHAAAIAQALAARGIPVVRHETLDDDAAAIAAAFRRAAADADLVIATGGLGPTLDDLTRDALADAMAAPLEEHADARRHLEAWAAARGRKIGPSNYRQVLLPKGAEPLPNPVGTAPGIRATLAGAQVFCLPGVPGEMRRMLSDQVLPRLAAAGEGHVALVRTVRTFGLPESVLGEKIADLMAAGRRPRVATAVRGGIIDVHIHASGPRDEVARLLAADADEVRRRLGPIVFAEGADEIETVVARLLERRRATLAVAESCTGGLVAAKLVSVPGISAWLVEAVVAYANESKVRRLGVPEDLIARHGAVSEPVARAMAEGARRGSGADVAIALTGIAGPAGGTTEKPVGTVWFALAHAGGAETAHYVFLGDRGQVRERAANFALDMLRRHLLGE
jgi:nicotinamide-nucleotide amidase